MKNALIVLNYKDSDTTLKFIEMALAVSFIEKIIVVDNNSCDGSLERLSVAISDRVDVINSGKNGGYAFGNNYGCRYAIDKYAPDVLFISNPDVSFKNETVEAMQTVLEKDKSIGVVAPIVNKGYNVWNLPGFGGLLESILLVTHNIHKRTIKKRLLVSTKSPVNVGVVEGSFWAIRTENFKKIGGLDERTFLYYEENILAKRLNSNSLKVCVLTDQRYDHYHSVSIKKRYGGKTRAFKNFHPSMLLYLNEYLGSNPLKRTIFEITFGLGYAERFIYDLINYILG